MNTFLYILLTWTIITPVIGEIVASYQASKSSKRDYRFTIRDTLLKLSHHVLIKEDQYTIIESGVWDRYWTFNMGGAFYWHYTDEVYITSQLHDSLTELQLDSIVGHELTHKQYKDRPYGYGAIRMLLMELRADYGSLAHGSAKGMLDIIRNGLKEQKAIMDSEGVLLAAAQLMTLRQQWFNGLFYIHAPRMIMLLLWRAVGK